MDDAIEHTGPGWQPAIDRRTTLALVAGGLKDMPRVTTQQRGQAIAERAVAYSSRAY